MSHSNSSLNTFASCMKKYEHNYILHTTPDKPISPHLVFGAMAHDVLHKAGELRDAHYDNVLTKDDYVSIIPSEVLYNDLKNYFNISSWETYFTGIIQKCAEYEDSIVKEIAKSGKAEIYREFKLSITPELMRSFGYTGITDTMVGIIDLLIVGNDCATIVDYKFSSTRKSQDDFDMNSQLQLYAFFVNKLLNIPLRNIRIGYIDIPKQDFAKPTILSNGTLSRSKSQNVTQELYEKSVIAIHGNDEYYNCKPGGYYYDVWCNLALNSIAYMSLQYVDEATYNGIMADLIDTAKMIDYMKLHNMPFLKKYDAYTCKACEYLTSCKPWLTVKGE